MKLIMATEAQRLIGISLAKIAQSRCVRGGVSLHKNLLVATVLQKARYLFMEEAFHMVHGHYINQQNSKLIEQQQQLLMQHHHQKLQMLQEQQQKLLQQQELENQKCEEDSELESIFNPLNSLSSSVTIRRITHEDYHSSASSEDDEDDDDDELEFFKHNNDSANSDDSNEEVNNVISNKENNPPSIKSDLTFLDLEVSNSKRSNTTTNGGVKRRLDMTDWENEDPILSILPKSKQTKFCSSDESSNSSSSSCEDSDSISDLSDNGLDFLSSNSKEETTTSLTSSPTTTTTSTIVTNTSNTTITAVTPLDNSNTNSSIENIDRITSLVSIFNFGNLQRSVSTPDLCSSQASKNNKDTVNDNNCCNLNTQRQYLAMTV